MTLNGITSIEKCSRSLYYSVNHERERPCTTVKIGLRIYTSRNVCTHAGIELYSADILCSYTAIALNGGRGPGRVTKAHPVLPLLLTVGIKLQAGVTGEARHTVRGGLALDLQICCCS